MRVAQKVLDLSHQYGGMSKIRYAHRLSSSEFRTGNFVLIGNRRGIPWIHLLEPQLNFSIEKDYRSGSYYFRNKSPGPGELATYGINNDGKPSQEGYADLAVLPNLEGSGYALLVSGITTDMTEVAGELATSPEFSSTIARLVHSQNGSGPYVEILLQANTSLGTARAPKIVCYRVPTSAGLMH